MWRTMEFKRAKRKKHILFTMIFYGTTGRNGKIGALIPICVPQKMGPLAFIAIAIAIATVLVATIQLPQTMIKG